MVDQHVLGKMTKMLGQNVLFRPTRNMVGQHKPAHTLQNEKDVRPARTLHDENARPARTLQNDLGNMVDQHVLFRTRNVPGQHVLFKTAKMLGQHVLFKMRNMLGQHVPTRYSRTARTLQTDKIC